MGMMFLLDDFLTHTLNTVTTDYYAIIQVVHAIVYMLYFFFAISIVMIAFALSHYATIERKTAKGLYDLLENFGKRNRSFETEIDFE